jgi:predicted negative regulator of RcsB-dependent stress response
VASNLTRKALKQDKFAVEVEHTVDYFSAHRRSFIRYGSVALAILVIAAAVYFFRNSQHSVREQVLGEAIALTVAPVGAAAPAGGISFPTDAAKQAAVAKAFQKIIADYGGSEEAYIAEYFLGSQSMDAGKMDDARKKYQDVADHGNVNYASLAKLALAQLDIAQNRGREGESLLKGLMDHPTDLVSKPQATIAYAKAIAPARPDEARKLLTSLMTPPSDISPIAGAALADLPPAGK